MMNAECCLKGKNLIKWKERNISEYDKWNTFTEHSLNKPGINGNY
jgi:hypothetical protein